jgi:hypothetical protein
MTEALYLRHQASLVLPADNAVPDRLREALQTYRGLLDRMETLQSLAIGMTGYARRHARAMADAAEDAYDAESARQRRSGRQAEYSSGRERQTDVSLEILQQRRTARQAQAVKDEAEDVVERIKSAYRWMDSTRRELSDTLRSLSWESNMER